MKPASLRTAAAALLRRLLGAASADAETEAFLRTRNVRLMIQEEDGRSFHAMRLDPSTDVNAFGHKFNIRLRYSERLVYVRLMDYDRNAVLADVALPDNPEAGTIHLNVHNVQMRIEVGPEPVE